MTRYCSDCKKEYDCSVKMEKKYTKREMEDIDQTNEDYTVINMIMNQLSFTFRE